MEVLTRLALIFFLSLTLAPLVAAVLGMWWAPQGDEPVIYWLVEQVMK